MMKKYRVTPVVYASLEPIEVEAENEEQALEKAQEEFSYETLCWQCASKVELSDEPMWEKGHVTEVVE